jgi:hypothetical protein
MFKAQPSNIPFDTPKLQHLPNLLNDKMPIHRMLPMTTNFRNPALHLSSTVLVDQKCTSAIISSTLCACNSIPPIHLTHQTPPKPVATLKNAKFQLKQLKPTFQSVNKIKTGFAKAAEI